MLQREIVGQILPLFSAFVFVLGTIVGSFLNVVVWRLPRGESLLHPGSHCPRCGHAIRPWENIPIVSWLALRARCSQCRLPISPRYPLVELATGVLFLGLWGRLWHSAMPLAALWGYLFLGAALLAASLIDIEHLLIPDAITRTGMVTALVLAGVFPETHLGTGLTGLPGSDQVVTAAVFEWLGGLGPALTSRRRLAALADALLGIALGYLMLRLLLEAGRRLWGRTRVSVETPVPATITATGIRIGQDDLEATWEDLLVHRGEEFRARAVTVTGAPPHAGSLLVAPSAADGPVGRGCQYPTPVASLPGDRQSPRAAKQDGEASSTGGPPGAPAETPVDLRVSRASLSLGGCATPLPGLAPITAHLVAWEYPRDVLGHGDLKLLAMIGGFLGPDATVFVLMGGAFVGFVGGMIGALLQPARRRQPLPFGPFLAAGTLFWLLLGERFVRWYGGLFGAAVN